MVVELEQKIGEENLYSGYRTGERNLYHLRNVYLWKIADVEVALRSLSQCLRANSSSR